MKTLKLRENFYWTGIVDANLRVFDIIMYTEFGTTYNSYVLKAGDKTILFETAKEKFFDEYLENLREIIDVEHIDYLVVEHTEPDHAGSVEKLLDLNPGMKIIATGCALGFLKEIVNRDFTGIAARDNMAMTIGDRTLRFLFVPNLHWPDTMYTYIEEEQILVTCDSFGSHYAFDGVLLSKVTDWEDYMKATKYYYDNIIGPFKPFMLKALARVRDFDISMICTGHGPVIDNKIDQILNLYEEWSTVVNPNPHKTVVIPYVSAYGYTKSLAEKIADGIRASGEIDVRAYDMVEADPSKVLEELGFADGILLGSPTILGEALKPIWDLTTSIFAGTHGQKLASAFGSYGWSGEAVPHLLDRLRQLNMKVEEGFKVRLKPDENNLQDAVGLNYTQHDMDGHIYAVHDQIESRGLWYNSDIFEKAGITEEVFADWDSFGEAMEKIRALDEDVYGYIAGQGSSYIVNTVMASTDEGKKMLESELTEDTINSEEFAAAFKTAANLDQANGSEHTTDDNGNLMAEFNTNGKAGVLFNGVWNASGIDASLTDAIEPALFPGNIAIASAGGGLAVANNMSDEKTELALEFIKYMTSAEVQEKIFTGVQANPCNTTVDLNALAEESDDAATRKLAQACSQVNEADTVVIDMNYTWGSDVDKAIINALMECAVSGTDIDARFAALQTELIALVA